MARKMKTMDGNTAAAAQRFNADFADGAHRAHLRKRQNRRKILPEIPC